MKILILECTAEELQANKTVMDSLVNALNRFTNTFCGVSITNPLSCNCCDDHTDSDNPYQE